MCESQAFDDLLDSPTGKGSDGFETMCSVIFGFGVVVSVAADCGDGFTSFRRDCGKGDVPLFFGFELFGVGGAGVSHETSAPLCDEIAMGAGEGTVEFFAANRLSGFRLLLPARVSLAIALAIAVSLVAVRS